MIQQELDGEMGRAAGTLLGVQLHDSTRCLCILNIVSVDVLTTYCKYLVPMWVQPAHCLICCVAELELELSLSRARADELETQLQSALQDNLKMMQQLHPSK